MTVSQLHFITNTLKDKHRYEDLPDKAIHKLSYLIYTKSNDRGANVSIPYFWYRYGVVTQQSVAADSDVSSPDLTSKDREIINKVTETVLEGYYNSSLEEVTDVTYKEAPYEVFSQWRRLDKQLSTVQDNYNPFFDNTPIRDEIEDKINRVQDSFPGERFPQHESDLSTWYFAMTRELDMGMENVDRMQHINTTFWGIFTLSVAEKEHPHMTREEVLECLGIESFDTELNHRRRKLNGLEREALDDRFAGGDGDLNAATDAVIEPLLESL